jgi:hypothetical protein
MFVRVVPMNQNPEFIAIMAIIGWDEAGCKEVLDELGTNGEVVNGYISDDLTAVNQLKNIKETFDGELYYTIGDEEGNRWFTNTVTIFKDSENKLWVNAKDCEW